MEDYFQVNLRFLPYDAQSCEVQFINWIYGSEVNLTNGLGYVGTSYFIPNPGWDLVSTAVGRTDDTLPGNITLPKVAFQLHLKRKPVYYMLNLVVPAVIMTAMSMLVLWLPAASGEKVNVRIKIIFVWQKSR